jgi:hypothetical protein
MGALSKYLRDVAGGGLSFWCAGCREAHTVWIQGHEPNDGRPRWSWNGDVERPVFGPSVLCRTYRYPSPYEPDTNPEHAEIRAMFEQRGRDGHDWMMDHPNWGRRCHTFVGCNGAQPGEIIYLSDCTHELAGQVLPLAEMPVYRGGE